MVKSDNGLCPYERLFPFVDFICYVIPCKNYLRLFEAPVVSRTTIVSTSIVLDRESVGTEFL